MSSEIMSEIELARANVQALEIAVRDQAARLTEINGENTRLCDELRRYRERVALLVSRLERLEVLHSAMAGVLRTKHSSIPPADPTARYVWRGGDAPRQTLPHPVGVVLDVDEEGRALVDVGIGATPATPAREPTAWDRALHADARRDPDGAAAWRDIVARHDRELAAQRERDAVLAFLAREALGAEASNGAQADCIRALWLAIDAGEHLAKRPLEPSERA